MSPWHGPSLSKDVQATYAADVLSYIMTQRNSGFQKRLVESGLCSFANFSYQTLNYTGPIRLVAQLSADKYGEAERVIFDELRKLEAEHPELVTPDSPPSASAAGRSPASNRSPTPSP